MCPLFSEHASSNASNLRLIADLPRGVSPKNISFDIDDGIITTTLFSKHKHHVKDMFGHKMGKERVFEARTTSFFMPSDAVQSLVTAKIENSESPYRLTCSIFSLADSPTRNRTHRQTSSSWTFLATFGLRQRRRRSTAPKRFVCPTPTPSPLCLIIRSTKNKN